MFGGIVYGLVGLVPMVPGFWKFMLTLVLFNLTTASVVVDRFCKYHRRQLGRVVQPAIYGIVDQPRDELPALQSMATHDLVLPCCI